MEAIFLPRASHRCFAVYRPASPSVPFHGAVLHVPAFAEEMNKSRRMVGLQSRALAEDGWSVLQLDLSGCGDSEGDFTEATWERWVTDVIEASRWLRDRAECRPALWGMRAGALVATRAATELTPAPDLLLWQPVISGTQHLQQFLRTKVMGQLFGAGAGEGERMGTQALRQAVQRGEPVEVAGYSIAPDLAAGLDAATLAAPTPGTRVAWIEVSSASPPSMSPASTARIQAWRASGVDVVTEVVEGMPFWQTQEIAECAPLLVATRAMLARWPA